MSMKVEEAVFRCYAQAGADMDDPPGIRALLVNRFLDPDLFRFTDRRVGVRGVNLEQTPDGPKVLVERRLKKHEAFYESELALACLLAEHIISAPGVYAHPTLVMRTAIALIAPLPAVSALAMKHGLEPAAVAEYFGLPFDCARARIERLQTFATTLFFPKLPQPPHPPPHKTKSERRIPVGRAS